MRPCFDKQLKLHIEWTAAWMRLTYQNSEWLARTMLSLTLANR